MTPEQKQLQYDAQYALAQKVMDTGVWPDYLSEAEIKAVKKIMGQYQQTPWDFYGWLTNIFHIDVDVCADVNNYKHNCYITEEMDAFTKDWRDIGHYNSNRVAWCNPPYSDPDRWMDAAIDQALQSDMTTLMLTHARTGAEGFNARKRNIDQLWMLTPRIKFEAPRGIKNTHNNRDSMLSIITPQSVRLQREPRVLCVDWKEMK